MRNRHKNDSQDQQLPDPRQETIVAPESQKPLWPVGLHLTKGEALKCFLPEDLRVVLTREAFEQLFAYAYATSNEISCLGSVRREGNTFTIERFYLLAQEGGRNRTEIDSEAIGTLMEELLRKGDGEEARSLKCWAHSHPGMGCFWSKTDEATCRLLVSNVLVSLVVSDGFKIRARVDVARPIPLTVDHVPVLCQVTPHPERRSHYAQEVQEKVKAQASLPAHAPLTSQEAQDGIEEDLWSDYHESRYGLPFQDDPLDIDRFDPFPML